MKPDELIPPGETVLFSDQENKRSYKELYLYLLMPAVLTSVLISPMLINFFTDSISFSSRSEYIYGAATFAVFISYAVVQTIGMLYNALIITDKRVLIRIGVFGRSYMINSRDIEGFSLYQKVVRSSFFCSVTFYLKNGRKIKTGNLFIYRDLTVKLQDILKNNLGIKELDKLEAALWKPQKTRVCEVYQKSEPVFPLAAITPLLISLILAALFLSGFNEKTGVKDIRIEGQIVSKAADQNKNGIKHSIKVSDRDSRKTYKIKIPSQEAFDNIKERQEVVLTAKKGGLGIVYDTVIHSGGTAFRVDDKQ